ncbi:MAG: triose-phosphate isomerase [Candidatus Marinimicrobia bacterium]|nr:triose-phosphate isomerase [Candidatus Neomarinimicrobiota bacterium]
MRKYFIAGNWKMNHTISETVEFCRQFRVKGLKNISSDIVLFPPSISIQSMIKTLENTPVKIGGQNMHKESNGAFTGEISSEMFVDSGCDYILIGHSERRQYFNETDKLVNEKLKKALKTKLQPVVCIGEKLEEREAGKTEEIILEQLKNGLKDITEADMQNVIIAYEPIWAIGTGLTAKPEQAQEIHALIRNTIKNDFSEHLGKNLRILYGGSAKVKSAKSLLSEKDIDGLLIGGASLKVDDFYEIIQIAENLTNK